MKAVRFHEFGGPDVLHVEEAAEPTPGPGEVVVRVASTSFNGVDANIRAGAMQGPIPVVLPHTPGLDVAGTVEELGEGVDRFRVGDAVVGFLPMTAPGASAELVLASAEGLAAAPTSIALSDAAALPVVGLTAWQALFDHGALSAGQRVLVNGASGAVGDYAVQLAKGAGARVVATASPQSAERVRSAGADEIIDYTAADVAAAVTEPVDLVLNLAPIDPERLAALALLVRPGGALVNTTVWMPAPSDESRGVRGIDLYVRNDAEQLSHLVELVDSGRLRVHVAERVPLAALSALHAKAASGGVSGKVVVLTTST